MSDQPNHDAVKSELKRLTDEFFRAVSFEPGEAPSYGSIHELFIEDGLLIKNTGATPEISRVRQFIEPRQAMVNSGELTRFRETEFSDSTEVFGNVAHRFSAYAKSGTLNGVPFEQASLASNHRSCQTLGLGRATAVTLQAALEVIVAAQFTTLKAEALKLSPE
jgi:hypothetical protein